MAAVNKSEVDAGIRAVKLRKARYALFKVNNQPDQPLEIVLDKQGEKKATKSDFLKDLSETQPRFAIYDYEYKTDDGRLTSTLYFIYWVPQNTNQVEKILVSSAKSNFTACLEGFKAVTAEDKETVEELLENEAASK